MYHKPPVFEDVLKIRVVDDLDSLNPELLPFLGHPIAKELATNISHLELRF